MPLGNSFKTSPVVCLSASVALDFAARCLGNASLFQQHYDCYLHLVFGGDGLPD